MRPRRRQKSVDNEFQDPLKNYDGPESVDPLERAIAEDPVTTMKTTPVSKVAADMTVLEAMQLMVKHSIASLLVVDDDDRLLGIFSERDVLTKVADRYEAIKDSPVSSVMTRDPMYIYSSDSPGKAMNLMATSSFRHVPILDVDDKVVGVLGPRRVTNFLKTHM